MEFLGSNEKCSFFPYFLQKENDFFFQAFIGSGRISRISQMSNISFFLVVIPFSLSFWIAKQVDQAQKAAWESKIDFFFPLHCQQQQEQRIKISSIDVLLYVDHRPEI